MSSQNDDSSVSKRDSELIDSDDLSSESFVQRKQFWQDLDTKKQEQQQFQPVAKPRGSIIKDSFDTDTSSLRSLQESKQVSRDDSLVAEDRLEDESYPASDRYDSDYSEKSSKQEKKEFKVQDTGFESFSEIEIAETLQDVKTSTISETIVSETQSSTHKEISLNRSMSKESENMEIKTETLQKVQQFDDLNLIETLSDNNQTISKDFVTKKISVEKQDFDIIETYMETKSEIVEQESKSTESEKTIKFFIGESSENVIKRSASDKQLEEEEEEDDEDGGIIISQKIAEAGFLREGLEIYDDTIIKAEIHDKKELKSHLMASSTDDSKLDLTLEEKSEFEVSEKKSVEKSPEQAKKSPQIIHSPVRAMTSFELEKPVEMENVPVSLAQATAIEVVKDLGTDMKKSLQLESFSDMQTKESFKFDAMTKRTIEELVVEQTLEEVGDSLDAVQEELIETVKDGKLIKQSPSEFEIKVLPDLKYPTDTISEHEELVQTESFAVEKLYEVKKSEPIIVETKEKAAEIYNKPTDTEESSAQSSNEDSFKLDVQRRTTPAKPGTNRWSVTDIESSSGESHYQSFDSRPLSSDVENLMQYQSSEYETAQDHSLVPGSTEYHSAVSALNSRTISSHESMKSLNSDSSGNLASIEASDVSETLIPSTMEECEEGLNSDLLEDNEKYSSLGDQSDATAKSESPIPSLMKRSHEMTFDSSEAIKSKVIDCIDLLDESKSSYDEKLGRSIEDLKYGSWEEVKFGSSLEEGSMLSVSISSASNLETMVEIHADQADMMGSLVGSFDSAKIYTSFTDEVSAQTPPEFDSLSKFDNLVMISSSTQKDSQTNVNTHITTTASNSEETDEKQLKKRGHKRTDSTSVFPGGFVKAESKDSSDSFEEDVVANEESSEAISSENNATNEESSDSDFDRYESEYARSFRVPFATGKGQSGKSKEKRETLDRDSEDKKSFSPGHSFIDTIVEDVHAETELSPEVKQERKQTQEYDIPNIQITEDVFDTEPVAEKPSQGVQYAKQVEYKMSEEEYQEILAKKYQSKLTDLKTEFEYEDDQQISPVNSDSFEMLEQPDISDEFVIVEEVAKEAHEFDQEGKSVGIQSMGKLIKKHDEDLEKYVIKSAPASSDAGSAYPRSDDVHFEFEESPPQDEEDGGNVRGNGGYPLENSKRWVEMNLADPGNLRYPYDLDRGILEDIKEEDTDFEVGSSRISSFKDSFSSTPDYDLLARKMHSREHDNISMNSLQEFESLEQVISLENRKQVASSQESLSNGSFPKRYLKGAHGDDISLSSLKEFEGLENACLEAHLIEIKAKEEAALLLSRSDDSSKSGGSSNGKNSSPKGASSVTRVTSSYTTRSFENGKPITECSENMRNQFELLQQRALQMLEEDNMNVMEVSTDSLEDKLVKQVYDKDAFQHLSSDSLDINKSSNVDLMTTSLDSIEASKGTGGKSGKSSEVDSIETSPRKRRSDSIDSIELQYAMSQASKMQRDSLDDMINFEEGSSSNMTSSTSTTKQGSAQYSRTTTTTVTSGGVSSSHTTYYEMPKDISSDSLNRTEPELLLTSTESLETSSTATNATYQNRTGSQMSGSITSCGSNTMIDTLDSNFPDFYSPTSQQQHPITSSTSFTQAMSASMYREHDDNSPLTFNVVTNSSQRTEVVSDATDDFQTNYKSGRLSHL